MSGMLGVGGGVVMVPAMVLIAGIAQSRAHATSLAAIVPIAAVGALIFAWASSVDFGAAAVMATAGVAGVRLGSELLGKLSDDELAVVFGAFLVLVAVFMLI